MSAVILWDYPKSSASYRVRIGLNLAGIDYHTETVDLADTAHKSPDHLLRNPQGLVPVLDIDGHRFTQSLAIIEYLDRTRHMGFLPADPAQRSKAMALAHIIAVDLHPVCNMSVMRHATGDQEPARSAWMHHFIRPALQAFEQQLRQFDQAPFATGDAPGLADICLIPQLYNASRWGVDHTDLPAIAAVAKACATLPAFSKAYPVD